MLISCYFKIGILINLLLYLSLYLSLYDFCGYIYALKLYAHLFKSYLIVFLTILLPIYNFSIIFLPIECLGN